MSMIDLEDDPLSNLGSAVVEAEARHLGAEESIAGLRAAIDRLGPVNMMALEEYQEAAQRHAFLDTIAALLLVGCCMYCAFQYWGSIDALVAFNSSSGHCSGHKDDREGNDSDDLSFSTGLVRPLFFHGLVSLSLVTPKYSSRS